MVDRPTEAQHLFTFEGCSILAGRDRRSGGCWLGVNERGVIAGITNNREIPFNSLAEVSRGDIVLDALSASDSSEFRRKLVESKQRYPNFNLFLIETHNVPRVWYLGSADRVHPEGEVVTCPSFAISNGTIHSEWPKMRIGLDLVKQAASQASTEARFVEVVFKVLTDTTQYPESIPSNTILAEASERLASSLFMPACEIEFTSMVPGKRRHEVFGTVSSAIILVSDHGATSYEVSWRDFGVSPDQDRQTAVSEHVRQHLKKEYISFNQ